MSTDFTTNALPSRRAGLFAHPFGRVLKVVFDQDSIEIGRMFFQSERPVEEFFGCDRKEFGFTGGSVGAEE